MVLGLQKNPTHRAKNQDRQVVTCFVSKTNTRWFFISLAGALSFSGKIGPPISYPREKSGVFLGLIFFLGTFPKTKNPPNKMMAGRIGHVASHISGQTFQGAMVQSRGKMRRAEGGS